MRRSPKKHRRSSTGAGARATMRTPPKQPRRRGTEPLDYNPSVAEAFSTKNLLVPLDAAGVRLDQWLASQLPEVSRVRIQQLIEQKKNLINGSTRSEEHTSELQSHSFISYAV